MLGQRSATHRLVIVFALAVFVALTLVAAPVAADDLSPTPLPDQDFIADPNSPNPSTDFNWNSEGVADPIDQAYTVEFDYKVIVDNTDQDPITGQKETFSYTIEKGTSNLVVLSLDDSLSEVEDGTALIKPGERVNGTGTIKFTVPKSGGGANNRIDESDTGPLEIGSPTDSYWKPPNVNTDASISQELTSPSDPSTTLNITDMVIYPEGSGANDNIGGRLRECPSDDIPCDNNPEGPGIGPGATVKIYDKPPSGGGTLLTTADTDDSGDWSAAINASKCPRSTFANVGNDDLKECTVFVEIDNQNRDFAIAQSFSSDSVLGGSLNTDSSAFSQHRIHVDQDSSGGQNANLTTYVEDTTITDTRPTGVVSDPTLEADIGADAEITSNDVTFSDQTSPTVWGSDTVTGSGTASVDPTLSGNGDYFVRVDAGDEYVYNQNDTATYSFELQGPEFDGLRPSGNTLTDTFSGTKLEADVVNVNNSITIEFFECTGTPCSDASNQNSVGTDSLASDGTVSTTYTPQERGRQLWFAEIQSTGLTSNLAGYRTPGEVQVYYQSNGSLIDNQQTTLSISRVGLSETLTTSNGKHGLEDLSTVSDEGHSIVASSPGMRPSGTYQVNPSLASSGGVLEIPLVKESDPVVNITWTHEDETGNFPSEDTKLIVADDFVNGSAVGDVYVSEVFGGSSIISQHAPNQAGVAKVVNVETGAENIVKSVSWGTQDDTIPIVIRGGRPGWDFVDTSEVPADGAVVQDGSTTFSIDVENLNGENVTVEFVNTDNNNVFGTTNIQGNGTLTASITDTLAPGETRTWGVRGSDNAGDSAALTGFRVSATGYVSFYDAEETTQLIDDRDIDVTVTDTQAGQILDETTISDGTYYLGQLSPIPDSDIRIDAEANGYFDRARLLSDAGQNASVFMQPLTEDPEVEPEGDLDVTITDTNSPIQATNKLIADVAVKNTGNASEDGKITLAPQSGTTGTNTPTLSKIWDAVSDWDNATAESSVVHESTTNTDYSDAGEVRLGAPTSNRVGENSLIGHWLLQEDSGSTAHDFAGTNDGSISGSPTLGATGLLGTSSYDFTGSDYIDLNDGGTLAPGDAARTYSFWFRREPGISSGEDFLATTDSSLDHTYTIRMDSNGVVNVFYDDDSSDGAETLSSASGFDDGSWHHVALTTTGSPSYDFILYIDGQQVDTASGESGIPPGGDLFIGAFNRASANTVNDHTKAQIADVRIYDSALSSGSVGELSSPDDGYLETATKSFASSVKPDITTQATLNGESITLDITGSPGTASEETQTVTLTGAGSYDPTWSSSHTEFRVNASLSTTDVTTTPTVSNLTLIRPGSSSSPTTAEVKDSQDVTLSAGENSTIQLEWSTNSNDAGSRTIVVESATDTDTEGVQINSAPTPDGDFDISITDTNSPVSEGDIVDADIQVVNNQGTQQSGNITLRADGGIVDFQNVSVAGGGSKTITLNWQTLRGDAGERIIEAESGADSDSETVTVNVADDRDLTANDSGLLDVTFELEDRSGQFDVSETTLVIKRPVNTSSGTQIREVGSGVFGAANRYGTQIESGVRHQLSIRQGGKQRDLGAFEIVQPGLYTLQVQPKDYNLTDGRPWSYKVDYVEQNFTLGGKDYAGYIEFNYADKQQATDLLNVFIDEFDADVPNNIFSENVEPGANASGISNYSVLVPLTQDQIEKRWVVSFEGQRSGQTIESEVVVGDTQEDVFGEVPTWLRQVIAFVLLIMIAGLFSPVNASLGAVVVSLVGGIMFVVGWLPGLVTAGGVLIAIGVSAMYKISESDRR